ncbi:MAG: hypothetical protein JSU67_14525 [Gammaproteobacteria bacterium]|nr:MAG: hypothetical protein JSU67_14525 [Gammaproteobacteria bacterium]
MKYFRKSLYALTFLLLTGCGGLADMAYNNAPNYVAGEIDDAFDLDPAQSDQLDNRLEQFFVWHRNEELMRYQQFLDRAALAAADGISATEVLGLRDEVFVAWNRALDKAIDSLGDLAVSLSDEQIERFERYYRERSEEFHDYLEKSEQQREIYRVNRAYKRLENWFGEFDYPLDDRIHERLRQIPDIYRPWFEFRQRRHKALIAALRNASTKGFDQSQLRRILVDPDSDHARAFAPAREAYWQAYATALEDISSWMSDQQRQRVVSRLQKYARIVERLRGQG